MSSTDNSLDIIPKFFSCLSTAAIVATVVPVFDINKKVLDSYSIHPQVICTSDIKYTAITSEKKHSLKDVYRKMEATELYKKAFVGMSIGEVIEVDI